MIERLKSGQVRSKSLEEGFATEQQLDGMVEAWETWRDTDEAMLAIMNGEAIVHKR